LTLSTIADQFNIEEFISLKTIPQAGNANILLRHLILNPLFSHLSKWVMEVSYTIFNGASTIDAKNCEGGTKAGWNKLSALPCRCFKHA
jgi:hypothetical protein